MSDELLQHFALLDDGADEPGDWYYLTDADVVEGALMPGWPNRMRRLFGGGLDVEVFGEGPVLRIRLPHDFAPRPLPDPLVELYEPRWDVEHNFVGASGVQKRWFERVGDETHLVMGITLS